MSVAHIRLASKDRRRCRRRRLFAIIRDLQQAQPRFAKNLKGTRMFENLTDRLSQTLRHVTGKAKLTEDNIKDTLREVRMALLEADVALPVVKDFVNKVKDRAVGT